MEKIVLKSKAQLVGRKIEEQGIIINNTGN
jgi:hypothetical protein